MAAKSFLVYLSDHHLDLINLLLYLDLSQSEQPGVTQLVILTPFAISDGPSQRWYNLEIVSWLLDQLDYKVRQNDQSSITEL